MNEFKDQWKIWHKIGNVIGFLALANMAGIFLGLFLDGKTGLFVVIISFMFMILLLFVSIIFTSRGDWLFARARDERLRAIYEQENTYGMGI